MVREAASHIHPLTGWYRRVMSDQPPLVDPRDPDSIARAFKSAVCVRCGATGGYDGLTPADARGKLDRAIEALEADGRDVRGFSLVGWCDDCAAVRDGWIAAMRWYLAGGDRTAPVKQAIADATTLVNRLRGEGVDFKHATGVTHELIDVTSEAAKRVHGLAIMVPDQFADPTAVDAFKTSLNGTGPRWAGTNSFAEVRARVAHAVTYEWATSKTDREDLSPAGMVAAHALPKLDAAHPIVIDPRQVNVLPDLTDAEAHDVAYTARLPFPIVYVDMTGPNGEVPDAAIEITSQSEPDVARITCAPVGALIWDNLDGTRWCIPFQQTSSVTKGVAVSAWGAVVLNDVEVPDSVTVSDIDNVAGVWCLGIHPDNGFDVTTPRGMIVPGIPASMVVEISQGRLERVDEVLDVLARDTYAMFTVAMQVLQFLDSANVDVAETVLHRRDRKRAEKRRWPVASTVTIRRRQSRRRDTLPPGEGRNFDYQFERAGHYNHVARGPHVRCAGCRGVGTVEAWAIRTSEGDLRPVPGEGVYMGDKGWPVGAELVAAARCGTCHGTGLDPSKVKPCTRRYDSGPNVGLPTCPDGCRREWVPTTVVGDPDKPLMLKTRRVPSPRS